ncbi:glutaminase [Photobacterium aphoticum]|uniref:glutaminase n=1 Tax=Photobacterium aphoticum TaxID=754436 RepID=A0A090R3C5_9GAMM|nr:glutaminase [Photobacterium aphoticum]
MKPTEQLLNEILDEVRPLIGQGKVADYIPALAEVPPHKLGIAVCYNDGEIIQAGDCEEGFSIQSISKVLSLTLAMSLYEPEEIWQRVGKEPSGHAFNSMIQLELENGIPRNPFINAGALVVSDMLHSRLSAPQYRMLELVRELACNPHIIYDKTVAASEMQHSDRNASIAYLMRSFGNFQNEVMPVLSNYFSYCALKMSCVDLARTFSYLANKGLPLGAKKQLSPKLRVSK